MDRAKLIQQMKETLTDLSKEDKALISMLENDLFPDISIERYLEIKADYRQELYEKGILIE